MVSSLPSTTQLINALFQTTIQEPPSLPIGTNTPQWLTLCPSIARYFKLIPLHHPHDHTLVGYSLSIPVLHHQHPIQLDVAIITHAVGYYPFFIHASIGVCYHPPQLGTPISMSALHHGIPPIELGVATWLAHHRIVRSPHDATHQIKGLWLRLAKWHCAGFELPLAELKKAADAYKKATAHEKDLLAIHRRIGHHPPEYQAKYKHCIARITYLSGHPIEHKSEGPDHTPTDTQHLVESSLANGSHWDTLPMPSCVLPYQAQWCQEDMAALKTWQPTAYLLLLCEANPSLPHAYARWVPKPIIEHLNAIQETRALSMTRIDPFHRQNPHHPLFGSTPTPHPVTPSLIRYYN